MKQTQLWSICNIRRVRKEGHLSAYLTLHTQCCHYCCCCDVQKILSWRVYFALVLIKDNVHYLISSKLKASHRSQRALELLIFSVNHKNRRRYSRERTVKKLDVASQERTGLFFMNDIFILCDRLGCFCSTLSWSLIFMLTGLSSVASEHVIYSSLLSLNILATSGGVNSNSSSVVKIRRICRPALRRSAYSPTRRRLLNQRTREKKKEKARGPRFFF